MKVNWIRIKECLHYLAHDSGAPIEYARGVIVTTAACMTSMGMGWNTVWQHMISMLPDKLRVTAIPKGFLNLEKETDWSINWKDVVPFEGLVDALPREQLESYCNPENSYWVGDEEWRWTVRDRMLDNYLHICSIFQRETDLVYDKYHQAVEDVGGESVEVNTMGGGVKVIQLHEPQLVYSFAPFRVAGSQHIAEWSVSDMRKQDKQTYNWHGQETSRWLYAGCLLVDGKRVSIHT
jgi:hypothetical protein